MMITVKDIPYLKVYRQKFYLPKNEKDAAFNSMIIFNNPTVEAGLELLEHKNIMLTNSRYFNFYIDRMYREKIRSKTIIRNERNYQKDIYEKIKASYQYLKTPFLSSQLMKKNFFYDLSIYNNIFFDNIASLGLKYKIELYFDYISKKFFNPTFSGYTNKSVFINIESWLKKDSWNNPVNYILIAFKRFPYLLQFLGDIDIVFYTPDFIMKINPSKLDKSMYSIFRRELNKMTNKLILNEEEFDEAIIKDEKDTNQESSEKEKEIIGTDYKPIRYGFTGGTFLDTQIPNTESEDNDSKDDINEINDIIDTSIETRITDVKNNNPNINDKDLINEVESDININKEVIDKIHQVIAKKKTGKTTASFQRDEELKKKQREIKLADKTVKDLLKVDLKELEIPSIKIEDSNIVTTNDNVKTIKFTNFEKAYNDKLSKSDTVKILTQMNDLNIPVYIKDMKIEDSSDELNYKDTYRVSLEDGNRVRHSLTFDVPKFIDDKFLYLNGSKKIITKQLFIKPIAKTDKDTVQVCSNYNKIFITRYGTKISPKIDKFKRLLNQTIPGIVIRHGDLSTINTKYKTVLEYDLLSEDIVSVETSKFTIMFNQDDVQSLLGDYDLKPDEFCVGFYKDKSPIIMKYSTEKINDLDIIDFIIFNGPTKFKEQYNDIKISTKSFMFSRATVMRKHVALILLLSYCEGLSTVLKKANVKYYFSDKSPRDLTDNEGSIQFADGYLIYDRYPFENSLLMNGLTIIPTKSLNFEDMDEKETYVELFHDLYNARNLSNAFDTFYEFMIDPITKEILNDLDYPTDFVSVLIAANRLLADNSYIAENNMNLYRVRSNEIINALIHKEIADAYSKYRATSSSTSPTKISIPKDAIIKKLLEVNTVEEHSTLNPIYEIEKTHTISQKGLSGMNLQDAYTEDKRAYDKSMMGIIGMSTSPDGNVGVSRKLTMEPNITNSRGFIDINDDDTSKLKDVNLFTSSEMLTPMGVSHDDAIRTAMATKQSTHIIPVDNASPVLVSNGMEQVIQYNLSKDFTVIAKQDGKVVDIDDKSGLVIIEYKDGTHEAIDIKPRVVKNSSSGFYISNKLNCDLTIGDKIKKNDIIAYDSKFFTNDGFNSNRFNLGSLQKVAIMSAYSTYEDSTFVTKKMSTDMASEIVMMTDTIIGSNSNVYKMVNIGDKVQVGDHLIEYDTSFDEEGLNTFLDSLDEDTKKEYTSLSRVPVKAKYSGVIEDIKMYCTVDLDELSPSLKKIVSNYYKRIDKKKSVLDKYDKTPGIVKAGVLLNEPTEKIKPTADGKIKGREVFDGVLIEFYIKYRDVIGVGDKVAYYSALKSIVGEVIEEGYEPFSEYRPNEEISTFIGPSAILARMTPAAMLIMFTNKVLIELKHQLRDIYEN